MDADQRAVAEQCLRAAHEGSMSFPQIVGALIASGFEGYWVDYRSGTQTFYRAGADTLALGMPARGGEVNAAFDAPAIAALVRWAQANGPDYTYAAFSDRARQAGCAGYLVSFPGRRVVYLGRTAETHVETFPN